MSIETWTKEVGPEEAKELLSVNNNNRSIRKQHLKRLEREMREGRWTLNGETIKIDEYGNLLDGQHRLTAIINTGVTVPLMIVKGLPSSTWESIDTCVRRTAPDALKREGFKNYTVVSSIVRHVYDYIKHGSFARRSSRYLSNRDFIEFMTQHPEIERSAAFVRQIQRSVYNDKLLGDPTLGAFHYLASLVSKVRADAFVSQVSSGENLSRKDPVFVLRKRLFRLNNERIGYASSNVRTINASFLIKTWNAVETGKTIKRLMFRETEDFPLIHGLSHTWLQEFKGEFQPAF